MKNKFLAALVVVLTIACLSGSILTSCSPLQNPEEAIRESLTHELDNYKNLDKTVVNEFIDDMDVDSLSIYDIDPNEFMESYFDGFEYSIDSISVDDDVATAVVTITCKSFTAYENALRESAQAMQEDKSLANMSRSQINSLMGTMIMNALASVETAPTDPIIIEYTKSSNNVWQPSETATKDIIAALMTN